MTIEQIKEEAKKRFDKDLTDEEAQAWLEAHPAGELQDEELDSVAGGCGLLGSKHTRKVCPDCGGKNLKQTREGNFWNNMCEDCGWHEGGVDY